MFDKIFITENEEYVEEAEVSISIDKDGIQLDVNINNTNLEELLKDKNRIRELYKKWLYYQKFVIDDDQYDAYVKNEDKIIDSLSNVEEVLLDLQKSSIKEFLDNHPILKDKRIVISDFKNITDKKEMLEIAKSAGEYKDKIYISMSNNEGIVKVIDCIDSMIKIETIARDIKSLNLSDAETVMYVYDFVRNRVYKQEEKDENHTISRNLNSVLNGEKIVCVGYSNLFDAILSSLGIKSGKVVLVKKDHSSSHERNMVYLKDDKYGIDGIYFFDTTWDSKKENESNEYLLSYLYFAKTFDEMNELEKNAYDYPLIKIPMHNFKESINKLVESGNDKIIIGKYASTLNYLNGFITENSIIDRLNFLEFSPVYHCYDKEKLDNELDILEKKVNSKIPAETYIRLLNKVRFIEYLQDPEYFRYDLNMLYSVFLNSKWEFDGFYSSLAEERLLFLIFGEKPENTKVDKRTQFINFARGKNLEYQINENKKSIIKKTNKDNN